MQCKDCGEEMVLGSMAGHMRTLHGRLSEERRIWAASTLGEELWMYWMAFPTVGGPWSCLVEGCLERAATRTAMLVHFLHLHFRDNVVILYKGNLPHLR